MDSSRRSNHVSCIACRKDHIQNKAIKKLALSIQTMIGNEVSLEEAFVAGNAAAYYRQSVTGTMDLIKSKFIIPQS
jgi:hypothetical protein